RVIFTPGGASPITVTSSVATTSPSRGLMMVRPTIKADGATGAPPAGGWPPGSAAGPDPGWGRISKPKMTRPAATITAAITTDGARDTRSRRRRALGEIAAPPLDSASSVDDSTCVSSGKLRPNGVLSPISAGAVAWSFGGTAVESPTLAVFSPHAGQNGRPAT